MRSSAQIDTVKRVLELFNQLPGDQHARHAQPAPAELLALFDPTFRGGVIVRIQTFFDQQSARREFDSL